MNFISRFLLLLLLTGTSYASDIPESVCNDGCSKDYSGLELKICSFTCGYGVAFNSVEGRAITTRDCPEIVERAEHQAVCRKGVQTYLNYTNGTTSEANRTTVPTITLTRQPGPTPEEIQRANDQREAAMRKVEDEKRQAKVREAESSKYWKERMEYEKAISERAAKKKLCALDDEGCKSSKVYNGPSRGVQK